MNILDFVNSITPLPPSSKAMLFHVFKLVRYPKGHLLLQEHMRSHKAYFIKQGVLHAYVCKEGKPVTYWIGMEGNVVYPSQLYSDNGEYGNVELLEDSALYELDLNRLQQLFSDDIHLANWGRIAAEKACVSLEKAMISRQFNTTLRRYEELINEYPEIVRRVPISIIASYLNTSPEHLSRIRARIK